MVYTSGGIHPPYSPQHKRYYAIIDAMSAEHDWLTAGMTAYIFAFDKISENFVKIYNKNLEFWEAFEELHCINCIWFNC